MLVTILTIYIYSPTTYSWHYNVHSWFCTHLVASMSIGLNLFSLKDTKAVNFFPTIGGLPIVYFLTIFVSDTFNFLTCNAYMRNRYWITKKLDIDFLKTTKIWKEWRDISRRCDPSVPELKLHTIKQMILTTSMLYFSFDYKLQNWPKQQN